MAISRANFSRQAAYVASRSASWAGDCLLIPDRANDALSSDAVRRYTNMLRETADTIDQMDSEAATPESP